jgi:hypothetical protein
MKVQYTLNWNKMKNTIITLLIALLAYLTYDSYMSRNFIPPDRVDALLDENTRVLSAEIRSQKAIADSIRSESEAMAKWIDDNKEKVIAYTRLSGQLRMYRDSLRTVQTRFDFSDLPQPNEPDTTIIHSETYTSGLFQVQCKVTFSGSGCITIESDLRQLRDIDISFTLTDRGHGYVNSYLHLPDFDLERSEQISFQPEPLERSTWERIKEAGLWLGIGVGLLKLLEFIL